MWQPEISASATRGAQRPAALLEEKPKFIPGESSGRIADTSMTAVPGW
jgi:hypothetical protein